VLTGKKKNHIEDVRRKERKKKKENGNGNGNEVAYSKVTATFGGSLL